ncbi:MAG TPA: hypothetical protein VFW05_10860 [Verrucomicrobiae bacterium]|nr:hypothetical protein [Verrucomicrobiae bacterium]
MKIFWDTSAAINALISPSAYARLQSGDHFARVHLLFEFFSIITGRGIAVTDQNGNPARLVLSTDDATAWLEQFAAKVRFVELNFREVLDALGEARKVGVAGGRVYDYGHALAADKENAEIILTRNPKDFESITKAKIEWP